MGSEEKRNGDTNVNISGNSQIGAIGSGATVSNNTFTQEIRQTNFDIDLNALTDELDTLLEHLKKDASEPEHYEALAGISKAKEASANGDSTKTMENLKKAGKLAFNWVFDVATKIGVSVAGKAIAKANGL